MPLAFPSETHGTIAFGFFNIETDMLLCRQLFFFADRFCQAIEDLAEGARQTSLPGWRIASPADIGDLHGAIAGTDLDGFIGQTYRRWPFPVDPAGFRQSPTGILVQPEVREMIQPFGRAESFPVRVDADRRSAHLAEIRFGRDALFALVRYVDRGGHPRWRDELRPDYVARMMRTVAASREPFWAEGRG